MSGSEQPKINLDAGIPTDYRGKNLYEEEMARVLGPSNGEAQEMKCGLVGRPIGNKAMLSSETPMDNVVLPKHYSRFQIEPVRFIGENQLNFFQGNIIKYVLRYDAKNGLEDVRKAGRYCRMFERYLMGDPDWWGSDPADKKVLDTLKLVFETFRLIVREHLAAGHPQRGALLNAITLLEAEHLHGKATNAKVAASLGSAAIQAGNNPG